MLHTSTYHLLDKWLIMVQGQSKGCFWQSPSYGPRGWPKYVTEPRGWLTLMLSHPSTGAALPALTRLLAEVSLVRTTLTPPGLQVQLLAELVAGAEQGQDRPSTSSVLVADSIPLSHRKCWRRSGGGNIWILPLCWQMILPATVQPQLWSCNGQALVVSPSANPSKKRKIDLDIQ